MVFKDIFNTNQAIKSKYFYLVLHMVISSLDFGGSRQLGSSMQDGDIGCTTKQLTAGFGGNFFYGFGGRNF